MAQVTESTYRDIEQTLCIASEAWESLPEVARDIDGWDLLEQLDFIVEWPLEEMRLNRLAEYASAGRMTPQQLARFERLQHLMKQNRPIIEQLQES